MTVEHCQWHVRQEDSIFSQQCRSDVAYRLIVHGGGPADGDILVCEEHKKYADTDKPWVTVEDVRSTA